MSKLDREYDRLRRERASLSEFETGLERYRRERDTAEYSDYRERVRRHNRANRAAIEPEQEKLP